MQKYFVLILLVLCTFISLPVRASSRQINDRYSFSLEIPAGWNIENNSATAMQATMHEQNYTLVTNVVVQNLPLTMDLATIRSCDIMRYLGIKTEQTSPTSSTSTGSTKLDGKKAAWIKLRSVQTISEHTAYFSAYIVWTIHGKRLYLLNAMAVAGSTEQASDALFAAKPLIMKMVKSFRFTDWDELATGPWSKNLGFLRSLPGLALLFILQIGAILLIRINVWKNALELAPAAWITVTIAALNILLMVGAGFRHNPFVVSCPAALAMFCLMTISLPLNHDK